MPHLVFCSSGRKLVWSPEEDALFVQKWKEGASGKELSYLFKTTPQNISRKASKLGLARTNVKSITKILREEMHVLEELSRHKDFSRKLVSKRFNAKNSYLDILFDTCVAIQARDALKANLGIDVVITPSGRLKNVSKKP